MAVRPIDNTSAFSPEMLKKAAKVEGAGEEATQSINQLANAILQSDGVALEVLGNLALHQDTTVAEAALNKLKHLYGETMDMVIHSVIEKVQEIRQSAWGIGLRGGIRLRGGGSSVERASFEGSSGASFEGAFEGTGSATASPTSPSLPRRSPSDILRPQRETRQTSPTQTTAPMETAQSGEATQSGESAQSGESTQSGESAQSASTKPKKTIPQKYKQARRAAEQKRQAIVGNESDGEGETKLSPPPKTKKPPKNPKDISSESSDGSFADDLYNAGRLGVPISQDKTELSSEGEFSDNFVDNSKGLEYDTYDLKNAPPQPSDYYSEPEASNARPPNAHTQSGYNSAPEFSKDSPKPSASVPSNSQTNDISSDEESQSKLSQLLNKKSNYSLVGDIELSSSSDEESATEATRGNSPTTPRGNVPARTSAPSQALNKATNQAPTRTTAQSSTEAIEQAVIAGKSLTDFSHHEGLSPTGKRVISVLSSLAQSEEGRQLIKSQMGGYLTPAKGEQALMVKLRGAVAVFVPLANNRTEMRFSWIGQTTQTVRHLPSNHLPLMLDAAIGEMGNKVDLPQDASILKQVFRLGGYEVKSQTDVIAKTAQLLPRTAAVLFSNKKGETMRVVRFIYGKNKQPEQVILSEEGNLRTVGVAKVKGGKFFVLMKDMSPKLATERF